MRIYHLHSDASYGDAVDDMVIVAENEDDARVRAVLRHRQADWDGDSGIWADADLTEIGATEDGPARVVVPKL